MIEESPGKLAPELRAFDALDRVSTPHSARVLWKAAVAGGMAVLVGLAFAPWRQTAPAKGRVLAFAPMERRQLVEAPVDARVARWHVQEGTRVRAGEPLVELRDVDPNLVTRLERELTAVRGRIAAAEGRRRSLTARAEALRRSRERAVRGAEERKRMADLRTRAAQEALAAAQAAELTARLNRDRQLALRERGLAADRAVELAELQLTRTQTDRARAGAALAAAQAEQSALAADLARVGTDGTAAIEDARGSAEGARADAENGRAELARLEVRRSRQAAQTVTAPREGVVFRLAAFELGGLVKAGDPLVMLVPETRDRAVEAWIAGNDAPLVRPGRTVRIQFEGFPAIQFSGWPDAAIGTFGGRVAFVETADDGEGRFRAVIVPEADAPWPDPAILRQGMQANVWVLLDVVTLGYELWRQFNGFPPNYVGEAVDKEPKVDAPAKRLRK
ncbi:MAG: HlyD family efflux transporter periplasmic adaptor subunit [Candidatus Sericytochromatia bacterium]|nr:HlyD family efflux transporter periplasmic adaptor subunit [Candidatus Sericytochromatia bacterium]